MCGRHVPFAAPPTRFVPARLPPGFQQKQFARIASAAFGAVVVTQASSGDTTPSATPVHVSRISFFSRQQHNPLARRVVLLGVDGDYLPTTYRLPIDLPIDLPTTLETTAIFYYLKRRYET